MIKVAITGALGRMGIAIAQEISHRKDMLVTQSIIRPNHQSNGISYGLFAPVSDNIALSDTIDENIDFDVLIDFTSADNTISNLEYCLKNKKAMVIGTTGLSDKQEMLIETASTHIPIVYAANTSVAVNLTYLLSILATKVMGGDSDIEIIEAHHKYKKDAPSGTALAIGKHIAETQGKQLDELAVYSRQGNNALRQQGEIGFSAIRGGDIAGEHTVMFAGDGERVEITQRATSRQTFAKGAVKAAHWVVRQPAGLYDMLDVLDLRQLAALLKQ